jgi:hypothetical protein
MSKTKKEKKSNKVRIKIEMIDADGKKAVYENEVETWTFKRKPNPYVNFIYDLEFKATATQAGTVTGQAGKPLGLARENAANAEPWFGDDD